MKAEAAIQTDAKLKFGHRATPGLVLLVSVGALYFPSITSLISQWRGHYSQGFLLALIAAGLVWRDRDRLTRVIVKPVPLGALFLLGFGLLWKFAHLLAVETAENYLLFLIVVGGVWTLYGWAFVKAMAVPLAILFLALPLHAPPVTWLQDITAGISVFLLQAVGVPVVWEGYMLHIPAGDFEVAETCAGWRFLEATFPLALLYAYFTYNSVKRRTLFILAALVVAVLANGIRAAGVVGLGQLLGIEAEIVRDHYSWGWFVYFFAMLILFSVGRRWGDVQEQNNGNERTRSDTQVDYRVAGLVAISLAIAPLFPFPGTDRAPDGELSLSSPFAELNAEAGANWSPALAGVFEEIETRLAIGGSSVEVYAGAFLLGSGSDYTSGSQRMFSDSWRRIAEHPVGQGVPLQELMLERSGLQRIVWYGYCASGRCVGSRFEAKALEARALLEGSSYVYVVALSTLSGLQADEARADLRKVWQSLELGI